MSHLYKREKKLTTKHTINKLSNANKRNVKEKINLLTRFDGFSSTSVGKREENKRDSLLSIDTPVKNISSPENEKDVFDFPTKCNTSSGKNNVFSETTLQGYENVSKSEGVFNEETKIDIPVFVQCLKSESDHKCKDDFSIFHTDNIFVKLEKSIKRSADSNDTVNNVKNESCLDDDVIIPREVSSKNSHSVSDEVDSLPEKLDIETINQCPICLQTVPKYLSHMKACAAKNKISTQQLLSALQLHKRQIAERKELGLDHPMTFRAKVSPKKSRVAINKKETQGPVDSSLQLALALSASLQAAEEDEVIQEAEALKEAGLAAEADQKLSTLEKFGFASAVLPAPMISKGSSKLRVPPPLLLTRTKEDRERIITEKVAIVLITDEEQVDLETFTTREHVVKSRLLKKICDKEAQLWSKAHCKENEERGMFYVNSLSEFVSPSKAEVGEGLRRVSQLPGRLNTPEKIEISELPTPLRITTSRGATTDISSASTVEKKSVAPDTSSNKVAEAWKKMVGDLELSDIEVRCRSGLMIAAHRLVFHVRCPSILKEIKKEENNKDVIIWENCSKSSVLAFLEFVYSGSLKRICNLDPEDLHSVVDLARKLDFSELKSHLRTLQKIKNSVWRSASKKGSTKRELFGEYSDFNNERKGNNASVSKGIVEGISEVSNFNQISKLNSAESCDGRRSPDMFGESGLMECEAMAEESQSDLDILASLVGKTTAEIGCKYNSLNKSQRNENYLIESPFEESINGSMSVKRKTFNTSFSEDEDTLLLKKQCSDSSQSESTKKFITEDAFDLTQSSGDSLNDELSLKTQQTCRDEASVVDGIIYNEPDQDDFMDGVTESISSSGEKLPDKKKQSHKVEPITLDLTTSNEQDHKDCLDGLTQTNTSLINSPQNVLFNYVNESRSQDYIDPIWDDFNDDYHHFNYEFQTPVKSSKKSSEVEINATPVTPISLSSSKTQSKFHCPNNISPTIISFGNKTSKISSEKILSPSSIKSPKIHYISSDSKSPKRLSQTTLDEYSQKSNSSAKEIKLSSRSLSSSNDSDRKFQGKSCSQGMVLQSSKPRKNLSSQFELSSPVRSFSQISVGARNESQPKTSLKCSPEKLSPGRREKLEESPSKRDSLAAMRRLLDDSLEISDSVFATADALLALEEKGRDEKEDVVSSCSSTSHHMKTTKNNSNKIKSLLVTPSPELIVSDNVTPLPDYSAMKTPSLKCSRKS